MSINPNGNRCDCVFSGLDINGRLNNVEKRLDDLEGHGGHAEVSLDGGCVKWVNDWQPLKIDDLPGDICKENAYDWQHDAGLSGWVDSNFIDAIRILRIESINQFQGNPIEYRYRPRQEEKKYQCHEEITPKQCYGCTEWGGPGIGCDDSSNCPRLKEPSHKELASEHLSIATGMSRQSADALIDAVMNLYKESATIPPEL